MGKNKSQILELNIILTFSLEIGTDPEGVLWGRSTTPPPHTIYGSNMGILARKMEIIM